MVSHPDRQPGHTRLTTLGQVTDLHEGRAAIVYGGGLDLPTESALARSMYPDAVHYSVNHHGFLLSLPRHRGRDLLEMRRARGDEACELVRMDYLVHLDDPIECCPDALGFDGPRISGLPNCSIRMLEFPRGSGSSAVVATWAAYIMGCAPVILCGIDCYSLGGYWHQPSFVSPGAGQDVAHWVEAWREHVGACMDPGVVRAAGGPLVGLFGAVEPGLKFPPREHWLYEREVEFVQPTTVAGGQYLPERDGKPPDVARFSYEVASWLVETGRARFR